MAQMSGMDKYKFRRALEQIEEAAGRGTELVSVYIPPEPVTSFLYRCDSKFYTEPRHELLAEKDVYGLLVIDWSEATLGLLRGKRIEVIKNLQSQVPSKHRMVGQSAG